MSLLFLARFFFFFQAEDGIRDDLVTGVQTCALPIYRLRGRLPVARARPGRRPAPAARGRADRAPGRDEHRADPEPAVVPRPACRRGGPPAARGPSPRPRPGPRGRRGLGPGPRDRPPGRTAAP